MARGCCIRQDGAPGCCCCRVEWAMWGNMNALYAAASEAESSWIDLENGKSSFSVSYL